MLDTNVFNFLLDGKIAVKHFEGYELCATHIQADEISRTGNVARRLALTTLFTSIVNEKVLTRRCGRI
jgi:hypothetical protein